MLKHCSFAAALAAFTFVASPAAGQARDPAAAQALFDDAGNLMNAGRDAEACPKLEESQRLDPGIGTLFHLADCYEKVGRVASAWAAFLDVASQARAAGQSDREEAANARASRLEPRLPKLKIRVPSASQAEGLAIRRDGVEVGSVAWGTPMPVDPGKHVVVASAPGRRTLVRNVTVEEGVVVDLELTPLLEENPPPATAAAPASAAPPADHPARHSANVWPWVFAGAGVVSAGIGTAFAVMASSDNKESKNHCRADQPNLCMDPGIELRNSAITKGNVATGAFAVSAGLAAVAVTLWVIGGSSSSSSSTASAPFRLNPVLGTNIVGADLGGSF